MKIEWEYTDLYFGRKVQVGPEEYIIGYIPENNDQTPVLIELSPNTGKVCRFKDGKAGALNWLNLQQAIPVV